MREENVRNSSRHLSRQSRAWEGYLPYRYHTFDWFFPLPEALPNNQKKPKPSREKEKVLQSYNKNKPTRKTFFSVNQVGSLNFQRYFFPLDGSGFFWYNAQIDQKSIAINFSQCIWFYEFSWVICQMQQYNYFCSFSDLYVVFLKIAFCTLW